MGKDYDKRISLGEAASRLLNDETVNSVIASGISEILDGLLSAIPGSEDAMRLHSRMIGLNEFKQRLRALQSDGEWAKKELQRAHSGNT